MRSWLPLLLLGVSTTLIATIGCSLTKESAECVSTTECREAFGTGYICGGEGLCELASVNIACTAQSPSDLLTAPEKYRNYVVLGSLMRAVGKEGARHDAAKLAVEAVNSYLIDNESNHPDLVDLRFGLVQCNHDGDASKVAELTEYLVDTVQVPAILGPASSSNTAAAFEQVNIDENTGEELRQVVLMSPSATSVALTGLETQLPGMLWRTAPTDDGQGALMGEYAKEEGLKFLAFYEDTPYGQGLFEQLEMETGELCDGCGISFEADTGDVLPLTRVLNRDSTLAALAEVDTVFFMGAQESHLQLMMESLTTDEFAGKTLFLSDAAASADTVAAAGEEIGRVIGTRPAAAEDGEASRFFTAAYQGRHDESPLIHSFTAHAYDATWLMLLASIKARLDDKAVDPESVAFGLRQLTSADWATQGEGECPAELLQDDVCEPITLDSIYLELIIEGLQAGKIDVQGASGDLDYNLSEEELDNSAEAFEFWSLEEGETNISIVGGLPGDKTAE